MMLEKWIISVFKQKAMKQAISKEMTSTLFTNAFWQWSWNKVIKIGNIPCSIQAHWYWLAVRVMQSQGEWPKRDSKWKDLPYRPLFCAMIAIQYDCTDTQQCLIPKMMCSLWGLSEAKETEKENCDEIFTLYYAINALTTKMYISILACHKLFNLL